MNKAETIAQLMVELTGRFEALASEASQLQLPQHQDLARISLLRDEARNALSLVDAIMALRNPGNLSGNGEQS